MTAAPLEQPALIDDPVADLPQGPRNVYKRAVANGFVVRISRGTAVVDKGQHEPLFGEDGKPLTTEKGRPRFTIVKVPTIVASIGLALQHDEHQQGQAGWWVDDAFDEGWCWPSDGSDIQRTISAPALGTIIDLDARREDSLTAARAVVTHLEQCPTCLDYAKAKKHLERR